jgi:chaperone modulatory protein CbpM
MEGRDDLRVGDVPPDLLDRWVEAGWLISHRGFSGSRFSDADLARSRLILDMQNLGVNDDSMAIILDLVDQVHGLRFLLRKLLMTMQAPSPGGDQT